MRLDSDVVGAKVRESMLRGAAGHGRRGSDFDGAVLSDSVTSGKAVQIQEGIASGVYKVDISRTSDKMARDLLGM